MITTITLMRSLRITAALALTTATLLGAARPAHAAGPRALTLQDFSDTLEADNATGTPDGIVSGVRFTHAILLHTHGATMSYFTHKFPGYVALSFVVGVPDSGTAGDTCELLLTVDGKQVKDLTKSYGQVGTKLVVPFGHASLIKLTVGEKTAPSCYLTIGDPMALPG